MIYKRANAEQPFMGLKNFSGDFPILKYIGISKNYLNEEEFLDNVLKTIGENLLQGAGTISHAQAIEKATEEYSKY